MEVVSLCPFRAVGLVWQPRPMVFTQLLVVKGTFDLVPGVARLAEIQDYPNEEDNHWDDDARRSLYSATDLVPSKPRADVLLVGHAFAPYGQEVESFVTRFVVGDVAKAIEVVSERAWTAEPRVRFGSRITKASLRYERASAGERSENPVGVPCDAPPDAFGMTPLPALQPAGFMLVRRDQKIPPVGYGPLAPSWPSRRDKLGRHAGTFDAARWHVEPMPSDLDASYFNAAPPDQQLQDIRADERVELENLHPDIPHLVTTLPGLRPRAFVERSGKPPEEVLLRCDTLWIDTDRQIATLTWRGQVALTAHDEAGNVYVAMEPPGRTLSFIDVSRLLGRPTGPSQTEEPSDEIEWIEPEDSGVHDRPSGLGATITTGRETDAAIAAGVAEVANPEAVAAFMKGAAKRTIFHGSGARATVLGLGSPMMDPTKAQAPTEAPLEPASPQDEAAPPAEAPPANEPPAAAATATVVEAGTEAANALSPAAGIGFGAAPKLQGATETPPDVIKTSFGDGKTALGDGKTSFGDGKTGFGDGKTGFGDGKTGFGDEKLVSGTTETPPGALQTRSPAAETTKTGEKTGAPAVAGDADAAEKGFEASQNSSEATKTSFEAPKTSLEASKPVFAQEAGFSGAPGVSPKAAAAPAKPASPTDAPAKPASPAAPASPQTAAPAKPAAPPRPAPIAVPEPEETPLPGSAAATAPPLAIGAGTAAPARTSSPPPKRFPSSPPSNPDKELPTEERLLRAGPREGLHILWFDADADDVAAKLGTGDTSARAALLSPSRVPAAPRSLTAVLEAAVDADGHFQPPAVTLTGDLSLTLAPLDRLRALLTVAAVIDPADERAAALRQKGERLLAGPSPEGAAWLAGRLADDLEATLASRAGAPDSLAGARRALHAARAYTRSLVLGGRQVRGLLRDAGGATLAVYIAEAACVHLPLDERFRARVVGELYPRVDATDPAPFAIRVAGIARIVTLLR
ncbi:MAG: DUF2169 domain-containing protein [Polyangiaceae bacterium]